MGAVIAAAVSPLKAVDFAYAAICPTMTLPAAVIAGQIEDETGRCDHFVQMEELPVRGASTKVLC